MSMNATEAAWSDSATRRATVDFPDPDPPAMPMTKGFTGCFAARPSCAKDAGVVGGRATAGVSRLRNWRLAVGARRRRGRARDGFKLAERDGRRQHGAS